MIKTTKAETLILLKTTLKTDARWAVRGMLRIYREQTSTEQSDDQTKIHNSVGFAPMDAFILSRFAKSAQQGWKMSPKQMALIHRKMPKYARQLIKLTGLDPIKKALTLK